MRSVFSHFIAAAVGVGLFMVVHDYGYKKGRQDEVDFADTYNEGWNDCDKETEEAFGPRSQPPRVITTMTASTR